MWSLDEFGIETKAKLVYSPQPMEQLIAPIRLELEIEDVVVEATTQRPLLHQIEQKVDGMRVSSSWNQSLQRMLRTLSPILSLHRHPSHAEMQCET